MLLPRSSTCRARVFFMWNLKWALAHCARVPGRCLCCLPFPLRIQVPWIVWGYSSQLPVEVLQWQKETSDVHAVTVDKKCTTKSARHNFLKLKYFQIVLIQFPRQAGKMMWRAVVGKCGRTRRFTFLSYNFHVIFWQRLCFSEWIVQTLSKIKCWVRRTALMDHWVPDKSSERWVMNSHIFPATHFDFGFRSVSLAINNKLVFAIWFLWRCEVMTAQNLVYYSACWFWGRTRESRQQLWAFTWCLQPSTSTTTLRQRSATSLGNCNVIPKKHEILQNRAPWRACQLNFNNSGQIITVWQQWISSASPEPWRISRRSSFWVENPIWIYEVCSDGGGRSGFSGTTNSPNWVNFFLQNL